MGLRHAALATDEYRSSLAEVHPDRPPHAAERFFLDGTEPLRFRCEPAPTKTKTIPPGTYSVAFYASSDAACSKPIARGEFEVKPGRRTIVGVDSAGTGNISLTFSSR